MVASVLVEELLINLTEAELWCRSEALRFRPEPGQVYCNVTFDVVTCWPATPAGSVATMPCPMSAYTDHTQNATYYCHPNGTWADIVNYLPCVPGKDEELPQRGPEQVDEAPVRVIYQVGFGISTLALLLALAIFLYFRSLRCLRNIIHCHLIVSFILKNLMYIVIHSMIEHVHRTNYEWVCKLKVTIINYLMCTNFFWMFVEGMYLFSMVVWAFSAGRIKHWHYIIVGWVIPIIITAAWAVTKALYDDELCWLPHSDTAYDYILHTPVIIVLVCNVFFLATIIWVLVTKLRASSTLETRQYRKAVRAILVLFPLLGLTYLLMFYGPASDTLLYTVFKYMNAVLQTLQGLLVAIFYCFLNGEVQAVLRKKVTSIQDSRGLFTRHTKSSFIGSPARSSLQAFSMTTCNNNNGRIGGGRVVSGKRPTSSSGGGGGGKRGKKGHSHGYFRQQQQQQRRHSETTTECPPEEEEEEEEEQQEGVAEEGVNML
ncbi:corticotropin-releasing factor receptor 2-like [Babylonia areolata]|uniref:corticotropin-releasing factor receptor 2-like n=1 Tax=Babylonia areolata TaxID=304850 RepID=UPI003FD5BC7B